MIAPSAPLAPSPVRGERPAAAIFGRLGWRAGRAGSQDYLWLFVLWVVVTGYNLFKPYHIDDTAHLEIARWIQSHPLHPMSGFLNWSGIDEPIWRTNQPHLYFYVLAGWARIFGFSEPATHALQSLAALACILLFHRLARALTGATAIWATAMLVLGPAFIVEQNLMVDVPLLAAWLAFFNLLICDIHAQDQTRRYGLAALVLAAALLIKYSSLVLFPILCISLLVERRRIQAWTALIPLTVLAAWSGFNYFDYGGVHIATRTQGAAHGGMWPLKFAVAWFIGVGALTPLGLIAAVQSRQGWRRSGWTVYSAVGLVFAALVAAVALGLVSDWRSDKLLWLAFAGNAALVCLALTPDVLALAKRKLWRSDIAIQAAPALYLLLWIAGTTVFYLLFSPFIAARHVLLILPPVILLLVARWNADLTRASKAFGLLLTVVVSAGLCLSDWRFAAFYRDEAAALARSLRRPGVVWASGHWGFQWYAERNGFRQIDVRSSPMHSGDFLLVAEDVDHQPLKRPVTLRFVRKNTETVPLMNLFCTGRNVRFYSYNYQEGPWSLSRGCVNHVDVFRISAEKQVPQGSLR